MTSFIAVLKRDLSDPWYTKGSIVNVDVIPGNISRVANIYIYKYDINSTMKNEYRITSYYKYLYTELDRYFISLLKMKPLQLK
jgi:hypothetical protein